jgi:hypothetical protein
MLAVHHLSNSRSLLCEELVSPSANNFTILAFYSRVYPSEIKRFLNHRQVKLFAGGDTSVVSH